MNEVLDRITDARMTKKHGRDHARSYRRADGRYVKICFCGKQYPDGALPGRTKLTNHLLRHQAEE